MEVWSICYISHIILSVMGFSLDFITAMCYIRWTRISRSQSMYNLCPYKWCYLRSSTGSFRFLRSLICGSRTGAHTDAMVLIMYLASLWRSRALCLASCWISSMSNTSSISDLSLTCPGSSRD